MTLKPIPLDDTTAKIWQRRFRIAVNAANPPSAEAVQWLEATLAEAIDRLRRHAVDETLSPGTMARFAQIRASLEPVESEGPVKWGWPKP